MKTYHGQNFHPQHLKVLQLTDQEAKDFDKLRLRFAEKLKKYSHEKDEEDLLLGLKRQKRAQVLLAFHHLSNNIFNTIYNEEQAEFLDAIFRGQTEKVQRMIKRKPKLLQFRTKGNNYPLLYITAMTGHADLVDIVIKTGPIIYYENDRSTPLHAAAWYNHYYVAKLLLDYGIPHNIKNCYGETPLQNAEGYVYDLLKQAQIDRFSQLASSLINKQQCKAVLNIKVKGQTVIRKIILKNYDKNFNQYVDAYHGTLLENMESIVTHGLKKAGDKVGDKLIQVNNGHISLGISHEEDEDDENWAGSVFTSPSIRYATRYPRGNPQKNIWIKDTDGQQRSWKTAVQVKVKKNSYKQIGDTIGDHHCRMRSQPQILQYKIKNDKDVEVIALMMLKRSWLGKYEQEMRCNFNETNEILLSSKEEKTMKSYLQSLMTAPQ